ncbi:uncharacterized protein LOC130046264 [Ostrea edulis]|uniref:uncharacterized protein LOC130046264 n=1 Tax=Ostrea edulis TaxID=37623 RepID=UPI0024AEB9D3|nr:uncharacterized protein LOC130046264 [Ostrea edulis]
MRQIFFGFLCFCVTCGLPPLTPEQEELVRQHGIKVLSLSSNNTSSYHGKRVSLKYKYVGTNGNIQNTRYGGDWLTVEATSSVSERGHYLAALIAARMTTHMPSTIFSSLVRSAKVAVFAHGQDITIFPAYASERDRPECTNNCGGSCAATCTFDGRKYNTLAGVGGNTCCILEDNLLCNGRDPYFHQNNILVHEFAHTIHSHLPSSIKTQITEAYNNARSRGIWSASSYAMSNEREYWAEGTGSFFMVNKQPTSTGGMNTCGHTHCQTEQEARYYIYQKDSKLYYALSYVYLNYQYTVPSQLATCITS